MAEDTGAERTEDPTPKRIADARKKGDVATPLYGGVGV